MKKKVILLSILSILLLFVLSGTTFASWSRGEFEEKVSQVYKIATINSNYPFDEMFSNFLSSSAYATYKDDIPFDDYESMFVRFGGGILVIGLHNFNNIFEVNSNGYIRASTDLTIPFVIAFDCDTRYWSFNIRNNYPQIDYWSFYTSGNQWNVYTSDNLFTLWFYNGQITNQYNKLIYGYNMTAKTPVYNGSTNVDVGEYYKLSTGFIGSYYYQNYQNLEYKIISNTMEEYIGLKNVYYTPTINGENVDIYIYIEPSMNQKGYKVVTYYNEEVLYQENAYNTLIVNSGGSSGDSGGGGGGSVDLTETNNLIIGLGNTIKSGDDKIVNTIKSGDERLIQAITSGDNKIIAALTDDSEVDFLLGEIYSSGDEINDLVSDLNFKRFDNPYQNLIFGTIENICDSLYGSGDAFIIINLHNGTQKRIYASEFYIQDKAIRSFVSSFLIFGIIFVLYNYFRKSIDSLSSGDSKKVIDNIEVDTNFIKM